MSFDLQAHWDMAYRKTPSESLGWYEEHPETSLGLIASCNLEKDAVLFNAGAGASNLIGNLLDEGYSNIIVNDIAAAALRELQSNLSKHKNSNLEFIVDDLTNPSELLKIRNVDLWHDRAVLHFFTSEADQKTYYDLVRNSVKDGGYVILAQFNKNGALKCSGLDVHRYNTEELQLGLGEEFKLLNAFDYTFTQPSGNTREYVYTLFKRTV